MLKSSMQRRFAARKLVRAAEVEADASLKSYFDTRLQAWTLQYLAVEQSRKKQLARNIAEERRTKIEQLARLVAFLPPDERWLVTEYVQKSSLGDFLSRETPVAVSKDFGSLDQCRLS
jgi:hypothetical protein